MRARVAQFLVIMSVVAPAGAGAFANVGVGERIEAETLPTLDGGAEPLLSPSAKANVFVFFRPGQEHSAETLRAMAACETEMQGKPVHWVAIVSSAWSPADVRELVAETGIRMPVLVDRNDRLYGKLGLRLHPVVGVADGQSRLLAYEPFLKVNYCDRIRAQIRFALGEIDAAELGRTLSPERATRPGEADGAALRRRQSLAEMLLRARQFDKAAAEAAAILAKDPRQATALAILAEARAGQGDCGEAESAADAALAIDPGLAGAIRAREACAGK